MANVTYREPMTGEVITREELEEEWEVINLFLGTIAPERPRKPLELEVAEYINTSIERGVLDFEVWD